MGLEPTRHRHTHLKRACLPIPALPHKAMPWHCKKYFSIPAAKKQGLFGLFFKLLTTVPSVKAEAQMNMGAFPSGQWGQTVNLLLNASVVRIHQLPPKEIRN